MASRDRERLGVGVVGVTGLVKPCATVTRANNVEGRSAHAMLSRRSSDEAVECSQFVSVGSVRHRRRCRRRRRCGRAYVLPPLKTQEGAGKVARTRVELREQLSDAYVVLPDGVLSYKSVDVCVWGYQYQIDQ